MANKWETLKGSLVLLQATGETKIPGYIKITDILCYMEQLEKAEKEGEILNV